MTNKRIDKRGYERGKIEHSDLTHRQIAYRYIYQPNKDNYALPFSKYVVHHINHRKKDNRVPNLLICTQKEHQEIHDAGYHRDAYSREEEMEVVEKLKKKYSKPAKPLPKKPIKTFRFVTQDILDKIESGEKEVEEGVKYLLDEGTTEPTEEQPTSGGHSGGGYGSAHGPDDEPIREPPKPIISGIGLIAIIILLALAMYAVSHNTIQASSAPISVDEAMQICAETCNEEKLAWGKSEELSYIECHCHDGRIYIDYETRSEISWDEVMRRSAAWKAKREG